MPAQQQPGGCPTDLFLRTGSLMAPQGLDELVDSETLSQAVMSEEQLRVQAELAASIEKHLGVAMPGTVSVLYRKLPSRTCLNP